MLRLRKAALHNGGAKDGSLPAADGLAGVGELVGRGTAWSQSLAVVADLDGNVVRQGPPHRHHLAAGGGNSRRLRRLLLLPATAGCKSKPFAERLWTMLLLRMVPGRVLLVVDDTPTQRYGPQVQGAGIHHNPTPGPADRKFLYGHIWVTISLACAIGCGKPSACRWSACCMCEPKISTRFPRSTTGSFTPSWSWQPNKCCSWRKWLKRSAKSCGSPPTGPMPSASF